MGKIWAVLLGLFGIIAILPGPAQAAAPRQLLADARTALAITKEDRILGNPDAPNTIIEYASLTCPHCAHFENEVLPERQWRFANRSACERDLQPCRSMILPSRILMTM